MNILRSASVQGRFLKLTMIRHKRWLILAGVAVGLAATIVLLVVFRRGKPVVKFEPGDRNVVAGQSMEWTFDNDPIGGLPAGAEVFSGTWAVRAEENAPTPPNVLCQTGTTTFPALCLSDKVYTDLTMSLRFKPIAGRDDQAAGILFRIQDKDNYYILRANALEDNVNFYRYASGIRTEIQGSDVKVASGQWQELRAEVTGSFFRGFLNGQLVVETTDDAYAAGKIGLWTKADSVTCFDNVQVTAR
jgi:hypothetical protein